MEYYFAPLEGITGYIYRNAHHAYFPSVNRYYTPFITPKQGKSFTAREWNDVLPEHNEGMDVVPQILTNQAEGFLKVAEKLKELGYKEVNLNLGCPSGTVVAKKKGSGFLAFPRELDAFLNGIFEKCELKISVKTRIGREDPEEFTQLLEIFNRYPLAQLIIHPRVQTDFYRNTPNTSVFAQALANSRNPVCYNGDLFSREKIENFRQQYPSVEAIMLGRGLLVNPALAEGLGDENGGGQAETAQFHTGGACPDSDRLIGFLDRLVTDYSRVLSGERDVLFKMKELWFYLGKGFPDGEKYVKKIRKAQNLTEYQAAVRQLMKECAWREPEIFLF